MSNIENSLHPLPVLLAGEEHSLFFDLDAQIGSVTTLKITSPGYQDIKFLKFLDAPYDQIDIVILLLHGINGAKRYAKETKFLKLDDAKELYQNHIKYIYGQASDIEDEEAAMKFVQDEQTKLWTSLQDATRAGMGFRKAKPKIEKKKEKAKELSSP